MSKPQHVIAQDFQHTLHRSLDETKEFGHKSLPCMSEILKLSYNSEIVRPTNLCISRVKQQFEWSDS